CTKSWARVAKWQTRLVQGQVPARAWGFKSLRAHHYSTKKRGLPVNPGTPFLMRPVPLRANALLAALLVQLHPLFADGLIVGLDGRRGGGDPGLIAGIP